MGGLGPRIFDAWMSQVHQFRMVCAKRPGNPLLVPPPEKTGSFSSVSGGELVTLRDVIFLHWWGLLTLCHGVCVPSKGANLLLCRTSIPGSRSTFWFFIFPGSGVYQGGSTEWQGGPQRGGWYHNLAFLQRFLSQFAKSQQAKVKIVLVNRVNCAFFFWWVPFGQQTWQAARRIFCCQRIYLHDVFSHFYCYRWCTKYYTSWSQDMIS